jgi:hypothetical protein
VDDGWTQCSYPTNKVLTNKTSLSHLILLKPSGSLSSAAEQIDVCPPGTEIVDGSPQKEHRGLCDTTIGSFDLQNSLPDTTLSTHAHFQ